MTDPDQPAVTPEDAVQVAQRALERANDADAQVQALEQRVTELEDDLLELQLRVEEFDDRAYEQLTLEDKVGRVREHAFSKAVDRGRPTVIKYDDVQWEVFDGEPSADHCYKLLRLAGDRPGFEYIDEPRSSEKAKRLQCDPSRAKDAASLLSANNAAEEGST